MEILGYVLSILIGVSLGLIGGGGSILTVPVLVYIFKIEVITATAYSLFIVGVTSAVGSVGYFKNGLVNTKAVLAFGLPSIIAVFFTRAYLVPAIPQQLGNIGSYIITKNTAIMLLFAVLMLLASYKMIKKTKKNDASSNDKPSNNFLMYAVQGLSVGMLTSIVGAGGGFLIIPALILLSKLEMKEAVGTSLVIIASNSLIGFLSAKSSTPNDWPFILSLSALAISGIFIGMLLSKKIEGSKLKFAFGWFVLIMGFYIILKETLLK